MLNSQILEVAIGLVFVYLLFSLVCSMLQEWFASAILKSRPKTLFNGIVSLINDPETVKKLYSHPLINALAKVSPEAMALEGLESSLRKQPSSIPSRTFALALLDVLAPAKDASGTQTLAEIRNKVSQPESPDWIKRALLPLLDAAPKDDLKKAYQNVEKWYDDAMERVSGWYKRRTQLYLVILALLVCFGMNVDTFAIANNLYHDSALRTTVVAAAEKAAKDSPSSEKNKDSEKRLQDAIDQVQKLNLPIGWVIKTTEDKKGCRLVPADWELLSIADKKPSSGDSQATAPKVLGAPANPVGGTQSAPNKEVSHRTSWSFKFLGWIFTALAVSLGAPFWFDLMNKLVNLRGAGKTPDPAAKKN